MEDKEHKEHRRGENEGKEEESEGKREGGKERGRAPLVSKDESG